MNTDGTVQSSWSAFQAAPPSTHVVRYEAESIGGNIEMERMTSELQHQPSMNMMEPLGAPRMDALGVDPRGAYYAGRGLPSADPPLQTVTYVFYFDTGHPTTEYQPVTNLQSTIERATASVGYLNLSAPDYDDFALTPKGPAPPSNPIVSISLGNKGTVNPATGSSSSKSNPIDNLATEHEYVPGLLAIRSALTDYTTVSTNSTRDTSSTSTLSAAAHDVVLQDYVPRTPLTTVGASYEQANLGPIGTDAATDVDGFIQTPSDSNGDDMFGSSDVIAHERAAVNNILRELHDVDVHPTADRADSVSAVVRSSTQDAESDQIDVPIDIAGNELPAGEVDGGMVLLQSNGDVYDSETDLTTLYADQLEKVVAPVGMETSVGIYEAMDVAAEEVPVENYGSSVEAASGVPHKTSVSEELPARAQPSSHKAAAIIGATTLTGALVWMNRNRNRDGEDGSSEDGRRHRG